MMKRTIWIAALAALAVAVSCGDDTKQPVKDVGTKKDTGGTKKDTGGVTPDKGLVLPDTGGTKKDTGGTKPDSGTPVACKPFLAKVNTGKLCKTDTECNADETCLGNDAGTAGACVGKCCADDAKPLDDAVNLCPVPDAAKQKAFCLWSITDDKGKDVGYMGCSFMCSVTLSGKTTTYSCPNATDKCVKSTDDPNYSYCDPQP